MTNFLNTLRTLSFELATLRKNEVIDKIKKLFINYASLHVETNELNELISKLIELSERDICDNDIDYFIYLISMHWLALVENNVSILFFGEKKNKEKLSGILSDTIKNLNYIPVDNNTNISEIETPTSSNNFTFVVYDDVGSKILKEKKRFNFFSFAYLEELLIDTTGGTEKEKISNLINRHILLKKRHYILLPLHNVITRLDF